MSDRTQIPRDIREGSYQQISLFDSSILGNAAVPQMKIIEDEALAV